MKTRELTGAVLNFYVAKAARYPLSSEWDADEEPGILIGTGAGDLEYFDPAGSWVDGGPIIEREHICIVQDDANSPWGAGIPGTAFAQGPTPLIAAMRAYVASKFGEEVSDAAITKDTP